MIESRRFVSDAGELASFCQRNQGLTIRLSCSHCPPDAAEIDRCLGTPTPTPDLLAFELTVPTWEDKRYLPEATALLQCAICERLPTANPIAVKTPTITTLVVSDREFEKVPRGAFEIIELEFLRRLNQALAYFENPCTAWQTPAFVINPGGGHAANS